MKYIKALIFFCLVNITLTFTPSNVIEANSNIGPQTIVIENDEEVEDIRINQEQLTLAKNAPKSGGVFPVEVTAVEGDKVIKRTLYIIVKPAISTEESVEIDENDNTGSVLVNNGDSSDGAGTTFDDIDELDKKGLVKYAQERTTFGVDENFSILVERFISFLFLLFLLMTFMAFQSLFFRLQSTVRKEVSKLEEM